MAKIPEMIETWQMVEAGKLARATIDVPELKPGEVLVSRTVKDLVAGSGLELVDSGVHSLKGVAGEWRLFTAG